MLEAALQSMLERSRTRYTLFYRQPDAEPGVLRHMKVDPLACGPSESIPLRSFVPRTAYYTE